MRRRGDKTRYISGGEDFAAAKYTCFLPAEKSIQECSCDCKEAFSDFVWMCQLDEVKGVNAGSTYRNDKSCSAFIRSISAVERLSTADKLNEADFLTAISDGSTDVSTIENEIVYIRACIKWEPISFVELVAVSKANANGIYRAIIKGVTGLDHGLKDKMIAFASDGAKYWLQESCDCSPVEECQPRNCDGPMIGA